MGSGKGLRRGAWGKRDGYRLAPWQGRCCKMAWSLPKLSMFRHGGKQTSLSDTVPYDPETQYPVIRASICTGERVAGFRNKTDGRFTEVLLIKSPEDERMFMEAYQLDELKTEY